jgi:hypothetical protein
VLVRHPTSPCAHRHTHSARMGDKAKPPVVKPPDGFAANPQMTTRRFPPPWTVEELDACFVRGDYATL